MIRKIIHIDREKCNGCGACARACHEGAIDMVGGKAELARENFCDGFGDCLPECPTGAITFEEREAPAYDEAAVKEAKRMQNQKSEAVPEQAQTPGGCPGSRMRELNARRESQDPRNCLTCPRCNRKRTVSLATPRSKRWITRRRSTNGSFAPIPGRTAVFSRTIWKAKFPAL